jgi:hypothetical protein
MQQDWLFPALSTFKCNNRMQQITMTVPNAADNSKLDDNQLLPPLLQYKEGPQCGCIPPYQTQMQHHRTK